MARCCWGRRSCGVCEDFERLAHDPLVRLGLSLFPVGLVPFVEILTCLGVFLVVWGV